jgi:hypothetical protein
MAGFNNIFSIDKKSEFNREYNLEKKSSRLPKEIEQYLSEMDLDALDQFLDEASNTATSLNNIQEEIIKNSEKVVGEVKDYNRSAQRIDEEIWRQFPTGFFRGSRDEKRAAAWKVCIRPHQKQRLAQYSMKSGDV